MYSQLPDQRPKAPADFLSRYQADNLHGTRTKVQQEHCACDNYKVILLMCEQLMLIDRMQKEDVLAIIRHDLETGPAVPLPLYRPEAPAGWWDDWTSDDFYTRTKTQIEYFAGDSFKVIYLMCMQLRHYDRLSDRHILAIIQEDMERHFVEEEALEEEDVA